MKIKEINRTANVAWSPKQQYPIYLAAGTAAQQLDATFSTTAALDIYHVDIANKEFDMPVAGSVPSEHRFHKLLWSDNGIASGMYPSGLILGGTDNGEICVFNASAILNGDHEHTLIQTLTDHVGPVQTLDINNFQSNIVASGASDSEIFIWDLSNPGIPLTPGLKTAPPDQISCLSWNHQVQHILASSTQTGRVVVWDLRKSEPIIKVGDQSAMFHYKSIAWHPDVATQMLIGNEDDRYPVIQMWDLRFATSPMKVFEGHSRGVLSLAWCPQDADLLMSCGKDNRILCWNPNSQAPNGEIIYKLPTTAQWTSDVSWCPRNPGLISTTAFDGHVTISTLMGGSQQMQQQQQSQISDSFGIQQDTFTAPASQQSATFIEPLKKPPKWMRRPCAARFCFGGKLVSFRNLNKPGVPKQVQVSQVVTETEFLSRAHQLEQSLITGQLIEFCDMKLLSEHDPKEQILWQFLKGNFDSEPRVAFLKLLGYNPQELAQKISSLTSQQSVPGKDSLGVNAAELASKIEKLKTDGSKTPEKLFGSGPTTPSTGLKTPGSESEGSALFDAIAAGSTLDEEVEVTEKIIEPFRIPTNDDTDGLVCQALLTGNFEAAVDVCFKDNRMADGLLLAIAGGPDLFARTQKRYLEHTQNAVSEMISSVVNRDWRTIVEHSVIDNWKEALSTLITYSKAEEFTELCCLLGERLENEINDFNSALICYICAGNVERLVSCWTRSNFGSETSALKLQNAIEKVMVLKSSVKHERSQPVVENNSHMAEQLCKYATLLSSQGNLQTAMVYLSTVSDQAVSVLIDRIFRAHGSLQGPAPEFPFQKFDLRPQPVNKQMAEAQTKVPTPTYGQPSFPTAQQTNSASLQHQFSPVTPNPPTLYCNPASEMYNPSSMYNPASTNQKNTYYTEPNQTKMYQLISNQPAPPQASQLYSSTGSYMPLQTFNPAQQQVSQFNPTQQAGQSLQTSQSKYNSQTTNNPSVFNPAANMGYQQPTVMQPTVMKPIAPPTAATPPTSAGHPMSMKAAKQENANVPQQNQPMNLYNPAAMQQQLGGIPASMQAPGMPPSSMMPGQTHLPPQNHIPPGQPLPPQPAKKAPSPKSEVVKGPIPAEHMILQQMLDATVDRCKNASHNPQTKRKLDDVRRKLEILYDLLREARISPNVLNGLHQMVQACQSRDYMVGIQVHTHMITTGNFSEISSFMPGLKTLMQIAGQLKI